MAKKRAPSPVRSLPALTFQRAARLYRLLTFLGSGPQTREALVRRLGQGVRGFYRALEALRHLGVRIDLAGGRYSLSQDVDEAAGRLPFPIPTLSLGEARQLARGRTAAHRSLASRIKAFESWRPAKGRRR
jgi:hypothetical protein